MTNIWLEAILSISVCQLLVACSAGPTVIEERHDAGGLESRGYLEDGMQVGKWTYYYEGGGKKASGRYADDLQEGKWTYWYKDGRKEMEGEFTGGRRTGLWTFWHTDGSRCAEGLFEDDLETGFWTFWRPGGERLRAGHFDRGRLINRWTYWYEGEKPEAEGLCLDGKKAGVWRFWDREGRVVEKAAPVPEGYEIVTERWPGGGLRREGFLHDGKPEGRWVTRHRSGEQRISGDLRRGEAEGLWEAWASDGRRLGVGPVRGVSLAGAWTVWKDGKRKMLEPRGLLAPPMVLGGWSEDDLPEKKSLEDVIVTWLEEACSPVQDEVPPGVLEAPPVEDVAVDDPGAPTAHVQPAFTIEQREKLEDLVEGFERGGVRYEKPTNRPRFSLQSGAPQYAAGRRDQGGKESISARLGGTLPVTRLRDGDGSEVDLQSFRGTKILFVILRGFDGRVCEYCAAQTMALGRHRREFEALDTEVLVVYPGRRSRLDAFVEAYQDQFRSRPPRFTFLYDAELELVNDLGIGPPEGKLAKPTTIILDKAGRIAFVYVGSSREDRPSVERILEEIEKLEAAGDAVRASG